MRFGTPSRNVRRTFRWILLSVLALDLLYLVPVNVLLWTKSFPRIVSEGEHRSFNLRHGFAWSLVPGRIHLHGLQLIGTDHNVTWRVNIDRVTFQTRLARLPKRQFSVAGLEGRGVEVQVDRHSPGFRVVIRKFLESVAREGRIDLETEPAGFPWRVSIHEVNLQDVRLVRIDEVAYRGESAIQGSFELLPGNYLELQNGRWEIRSGELRAGDVPILHGMRSVGLVRIHPAALKKAPGSLVYRTMDIEHRLEADVLGAHGFAALLHGYRPMIFGRADGKLSSVLHVEKGVILPGSSIESDFRKIHLVLAGATLAGEGRLRWRVEPPRDRKLPPGKLDFRLDRVEWRATDARVPGSVLLARSRNFRIQGITRQLSLTKPFTDLDLRIALRNAEMGSIHAVLRHLLKNDARSYPVVASSAGQFDFAGRLVPSEGRFDGALDLRADALTVSYDEGETKLQARLDSRIELRSRDYDSGKFTLRSGRFDLTDVRLERKDRDVYSVSDWKMRVALRESRLVTKPDADLSGDFRVEMSDVRVPLRFALPEASWVPLATFFYPMNRFDLRGKLRAGGRGFELTSLSADSSTGRLFGWAQVKDGEAGANFFLELNPVNLCLDKRGRNDLEVDVGAKAAACLRSMPEPLRPLHERRLGE